MPFVKANIIGAETLFKTGQSGTLRVSHPTRCDALSTPNSTRSSGTDGHR